MRVTSLGMRIDIPRTSVENQVEGCWWVDRDDHVVLSCPQCGHAAALTNGHAVSKTGILKPSLLCACGLHRDVRLLEWGK